MEICEPSNAAFLEALRGESAKDVGSVGWGNEALDSEGKERTIAGGSGGGAK
jgi:hypothetical protein